MEVKHKQYKIKIVNASSYTLNSSDNIEEYKYEYFQGTQNEDRVYPTSKQGIRVFENEEELNSAIVCEVGGATGIQENSFLVEEDNILICCCDKIYSLKIPELSINWTKRLDPATCFAIYKFKGDLIIHGELQISRIDLQGNEKWNFGARDIFVTQDGTESIQIEQETIKLKDWEGYEYILDEFGKEIN
jgi:hypothetical protein